MKLPQKLNVDVGGLEENFKRKLGESLSSCN